MRLISTVAAVLITVSGHADAKNTANSIVVIDSNTSATDFKRGKAVFVLASM